VKPTTDGAADGTICRSRPRTTRSVTCAAMYRWGKRVSALAAATVTTVVAVGCSHTVVGTVQRAGPSVSDPNRNYGYADDQCGLLADDSIKEALAAEHIVRPYSGAVCQYVLERKSGLIDVVFSWFYAGTLARERAVAAERGEQITDTEVVRRPAFLARKGGAACSATAAAGSGVLTWWVQFRPQGDDPCPAAEKLLAATLSSDL
jgi:hypothetical protein